MAKSWILGSAPDCDLVINQPTVSGRHCRLTRDESGYMLEDLGSTNGTYVNGQRITLKIAVTKRDSVTVGQTVPMPWPDEAPAPLLRTFRIGREPDNDYVVNLPTVSGYHARIFWDSAAGSLVIEDLKSSNGTAIGSLDNKITRSVLSPRDTIFLGAHSVPAAQILMLFDSAAAAPAPLTAGRFTPAGVGVGVARAALATTTQQTAPSTPVASVSLTPEGGLSQELRRAVDPKWALAVLFAHALVAALVVRFGPSGVAVSLFWLGFVSIWLGVSNVVIVEGISRVSNRPRDPRESATSVRWAARVVVLGAVSLGQSLLTWIVVSETGGAVHGSGAALGLLIVASAVGLASGLAIVALIPRVQYGLATLPLILLVLWFLGGEQRPVVQMPSWAKALSNVVPSRWAFEGLLLLDLDRPSGEVRAGGGGDSGGSAADSSADRDIAEDYFPLDTDRMGVKADTIALAAMFIGLLALSWFLSVSSPGSRASSTEPGASKPRGAPGSGFR
jgi:pSer/pThr/pTyr-binding forkhead associated (FHA) protein